MSAGPFALYCERTDPGLWAEPVNALTNLAFLIAAALAARLLAGRETELRAAWDLWLLVAALAAIGIGSGLWHSYPTRWSGLADVLPILVFINLYLVTALRRLLRLRWRYVFTGFAAYQLCNQSVQWLAPADTLNGSVWYLPTWAALLALATVLTRRAHASGPRLLTASGLFALSLAFRSIDQAVCPVWPVGTHFLWPLLNAVVLYLAFSALLRTQRDYSPPPPPSPPPQSSPTPPLPPDMPARSRPLLRRKSTSQIAKASTTRRSTIGRSTERRTDSLLMSVK
jgi:hypothetical protein